MINSLNNLRFLGEWSDSNLPVGSSFLKGNYFKVTSVTALNLLPSGYALPGDTLMFDGDNWINFGNIVEISNARQYFDGPGAEYAYLFIQQPE